MPVKKYQVRETIVTVTADEEYHPVCLDSIRRSRADLERHILEDPFFKVTFEPYECPADAPEVVRRMVAATARVEGPQGEIVVNVPDDNCREVVSVLRHKKVEVTRLDVPITKDEEGCVHCGACVSVCPVGAIAYEYDWRVRMDEKVCVQCGNCVNACPVRAIRLPID